MNDKIDYWKVNIPSRKRYDKHDKHDKASHPGRQNNNNPVTQVGHRSQFREGTNADKQRGGRPTKASREGAHVVRQC